MQNRVWHEVEKVQNLPKRTRTVENRRTWRATISLKEMVWNHWDSAFSQLESGPKTEISAAAFAVSVPRSF